MVEFDDISDLARVSVQGVARREAVGAVMTQMEKQAEREANRPPPAPKAPKMMSPPPMPKPPPPPTKHELEKMTEELEYPVRQELLDRIGKYKQRFPQLKSRNKGLGIKSSLVELRDEVHYIEEQLGSDENQKGVRPTNMAFVAGMFALEKSTAYWNPLNLKLQGLGQTVQVSMSEFEPLLDEYCIKHGMDLGAAVEIRLVGMIVLTVASVHAANSGAGTDLLARFKGGEAEADDKAK